MKEKNDELELLIELVQGLIEEEGFKVSRASEEGKHTTDYEFLIIRADHLEQKDVEYRISFGTFHPKWFEKTSREIHGK